MTRFAFVASVAMFSGCALFGGGSAKPADQATSPLPSSAETVLGQGDVVDIKVYREPELAGAYRVSQKGTIDFPLIGKVNLLGRDTFSIGEDIRARLADGYLVNPQVSVFVREYNSKKIHVLGQVEKAGSFKFEAGMTIIEAITEAGGFTKLASTNGVRVTRVVAGDEEKYTVPVGDIRSGNAPNFELAAGDIVFIPEAIF